jgi:hypothetical protein
MAHLRRQIREGVATALAATGYPTFSSRVDPLEITDLPAFVVYTRSERSQQLKITGNQVLDRTVTILVESYARELQDVDDVIDDICVQIEVALANPVSALAGIAQNITLTATEIEMTGTSEKPLAKATLTFDVQYFAAENAPDVAL